MIHSANSLLDLDETLNQMGLGAALKQSGSALIKINLTRPPDPDHPRTDPALLAQVIRYIAAQGAGCAIAEGADGFLPHNIEQTGLGKVVKENRVRVIDLDLEDCDCVVVEGENHYLPRCLKDYGLRMGIPALSKRPGMIFSNNVKLFVGAVPRRMYQLDEKSPIPRPRVHLDLHRSVANIYRAVMQYAPFGCFINGGAMMIEGQGELIRPEILLGRDGVELDRHWLKHFNLDVPEYIQRLMTEPAAP